MVSKTRGTPIVAYEAARQERIRRNQELLDGLGIENCVPKPHERIEKDNGREKRPREPRGTHAPTRRSGRLRGEAAPELELLDEDDIARAAAAEASARKKRVALSRLEDPETLDSLNLYRVQTMSDEALLRRIWKIRRSDKMDSFIKVRLSGEVRTEPDCVV